MGCSDETAMQHSTTQEPVFHEEYMHVTKCVQHCWTAGVQYAQVSNLSVCFFISKSLILLSEIGSSTHHRSPLI